MRPIYPAILFIGLAACVTLNALKDPVRQALDAQGDIVEGVNMLDALCQREAHTNADLIACRSPRDKARDGLRRQLKALGSIGGAR